MNKYIYILVFLILLPFQLSGETKHRNTGYTLGGTNIIGINREYPKPNYSLDINLGIMGIYEICVAVRYKKYLPGSKIKPYIGAGLWSVIIPFGGALFIADFPFGIDYNLSATSSIGFEINLGYFLYCFEPGREVTFNRPYILLPGIYYKKKM